MSETYAVLVRGMNDEGPFISEFIAYYLRIGFDHIYFINTEGDDNYFYENIAKTNCSSASVLNMPNTFVDWQEEVLNRAIDFVNEDWVLNVDMDEFLYVNGNNIKVYMSGIPSGVNKMRFLWLMCLSKKYTQKSVFDICEEPIYMSNSFKSMAKKEAILRMDIHDIEIRYGDCFIARTSRNGAYILHFASRGFYDLVNRIIGRNYENIKSGELQESLLAMFFRDQKLSEKNFPFRFNMYRIELSFPRIDFKHDWKSILAQDGINNDLLRNIFVDKIAKIGVIIPLTVLDNLECYIEETYGLKKRILASNIDPRFAKMHFEEGLSYINLTKLYIQSLMLS